MAGWMDGWMDGWINDGVIVIQNYWNRIGVY